MDANLDFTPLNLETTSKRTIELHWTYQPNKQLENEKLILKFMISSNCAYIIF